MLKKVYVEITNVCNLACSFCPGTGREKRFMSPKEFRTIAEKLRGRTNFLYFHLMGEPLLHPALGELLAIAGEKGFRVIVTTNGTLLPERGEELARSPALHRANISLQAFEANAENGTLKDYVNQCAVFAEKLSSAGKICSLRLWNGGGAEKLNGEIERLLSLRFPKPWTPGATNLTLRDRVFLEYGQMFDWPDLSAADYGAECFCHGLRDHVGVLCDGTVVPCCLDHEGDMALGNLFEQDFDEICSSPRARAIYAGFSGRTAVEELCRRCGYARRF